MHMEPYDAMWLVLLWTIVLLHGWLSAAMAAIHCLGSQLHKLSEQQPALTYYLTHKNRLKLTHTVETITSAVLLPLCLRGMFRGSFDTSAVLICTAAGLLLLLLSDSVGKGVGRKYAQGAAKRSAVFVRILSAVYLPLYGICAGIESILGGKREAEEQVTEEDIMQLLDAGNETGAIEEQQREMINNIFEFDDLPVSDVMTHRTEIVAVDIEMKINDVICLVRDENYSRMPVYQERVDNIVGVLNAKDLLGLVGCRDISGFHIRHFLREALFVPETAKCDDVLSEMLRKKMQMAIVVDEYGGTEGLVCMEDILEEIVGNIQDEYDEEEVDLCRVTDSIYTIDGNADPDEILPQLGLSVPENVELDTMGGFLVELLGRIPEPQEKPSVEWNGVRFSVLLMEDNWIEKLKAEILPKAVQLCETEGGK